MNKILIGFNTLVVTAGLSLLSQAFALSYEVKGVEDWDTLNMRSSASAKSEVVVKIPFNGKQLKSTGNTKKNGKTTWVEVIWQGKKGWVSRRYIKSMVAATPESNAKKAEADNAKTEKKTAATKNEKQQVVANKTNKDIKKPSKDDVKKLGRNIRISEKIVGNTKSKKVRKPQKSVGSWVLQCGNTKPFWVVQVFPEHLEMEVDTEKTTVPIVAKHQEKSVYNTALKTLVKGRNQATNVSLDITFTRNCMDPFINKKVPYAIKANYNGKIMAGCCKAVRVE